MDKATARKYNTNVRGNIVSLYCWLSFFFFFNKPYLLPVIASWVWGDVLDNKLLCVWNWDL